MRNIIADIKDDICYGVVYPVRHWFNNHIYYPIQNLHIFWKDIKSFRPWDHEHCVNMYTTALDALCNYIRTDGYEEDTVRMKKVEKMEELLWLLQNDPDNNLDKIQDAWYAKHKNGKGFNEYMRKLRSKWEKDIFRILEGQSDKEFDKKYKDNIEHMKTNHPDIYKVDESQCDYPEWADAFDGTGCQAWWS